MGTSPSIGENLAVKLPGRVAEITGFGNVSDRFGSECVYCRMLRYTSGGPCSLPTANRESGRIGKLRRRINPRSERKFPDPSPVQSEVKASSSDRNQRRKIRDDPIRRRNRKRDPGKDSNSIGLNIWDSGVSGMLVSG